MLRTIPTRSGYATVSYEGKYLHSKYDPYREAERFTAAQSFDGVEVCILIEPGLDYLSRAVMNACPHMRCISVHCSDALRGSARDKAAGGSASHGSKSSNISPGGFEAEFYPSDDISLHAFLGRHIDDAELAATKILEWEPSASAFGEAYSRLLNGVYGYVRERNASLNTTGLFGRRWITRRITSFLELTEVSAPQEVGRPLIVAASGPSLEKSLPLISAHRKHFSVWAFSSALAPLAAYGVEPDCIFHSDAGYYAALYLRGYGSGSATLSSSEPRPAEHGFDAYPVLAAPLTASTDHDISAALPRLMLLSESRMERFLTEGLPIPRLDIPSHGTVAGTAYYAASQLARNAVFFAGLDLAYLDTRAHAAGHAFYPLHLSTADRMRPLHTIYFDRSPLAAESPPSRKGSWLQNSALETYSRWFANRSTDARFFRIEPSEVELPPFRSVRIEEFERYAGSLTDEGSGSTEDPGGPAASSPPIPAPPLHERIARARQFTEKIRSLSEELADSENGEDAAAYVGSDPMLYEFSEECNVSALLRLRRSGHSSDLKELLESLYSMRKKMETIVTAYETQ